MVLYQMDNVSTERLSDKPYSVFAIMKFFHGEEKFHCTIWPARTRHEHEIMLKRYAMYLKLPKHTRCLPYFHKLATIPQFMRFGCSEDTVLFREDITNQDEYRTIIEEALFIPLKEVESTLAMHFVNKVTPVADISFVKEQDPNEADTITDGVNQNGQYRNEDFPL